MGPLATTALTNPIGYGLRGRRVSRKWANQLATSSPRGEGETRANRVQQFCKFSSAHATAKCLVSISSFKKKNNEIYFFFRRCCDVNLDINQFDHAPYSAHSAEIVHFFIAMKLSLYFFYGGTVVISFFLDFKMIFFRDGILISSPLKWINFFKKC